MTYEVDGVEYEKCKGCNKEIIATKSHRCLDCFQSGKTEETRITPGAYEILGSYQRLGQRSWSS